MTINLPNGNTLTIVPSDSSARYAQLTGDDWIELKWESPEHVEIPVGSSVTFQGITYVIERPQDVTIQHSRNYEYTVRFDTVAERLKYIKFVNPDDGRVSFPVTGDANTHLELLIRGVNALSPETWTAGNTIADNKEAVISYDSLSIYEAIELIAETFATEFEIVGTAIYIHKVEYNKSLPLVLSYGNGNGLLPGIKRRNYGDRPPVVALAVKGGNRNLNTSTNTNAYDAKTLHMPVELSHGVAMVIGYDGSKFAYSDAWDAGAGYHYAQETGFDTSNAKYYVIGNSGKILYYAGTNGTTPTMPALAAGTDMDVADLTDIYPAVTHSVTAVETRQEPVQEEGSTETYYTAYNVKIQTTIDYEDAQIPGSSSLTIIFQSGQLTGKEFDANYTLDNGVGTFVIISKFIDDERMPGGTLIPAVGDTLRVFNCMLPDTYIRNDSDYSGAEWDMARKAVKTLFAEGCLHYTWEADLSGIYAAGLPQASFDKIKIGGYVSISDPSVQSSSLLIRITEIKQPLNHPKWVEIKLEDYTRLRRRRRHEAMSDSAERLTITGFQQALQTHSNMIAERPTIVATKEIVSETESEERAQAAQTTQYWSDHSTYVPAEGEIVIYTDGGAVTQGGVTKDVPKIKIGDGVTTIGNLPFIDSDTQQGTAGTLNTTNTSGQTPNASESLSGNVNLHKVSKTGLYEDLLNKPTIPAVNDAVLTIQKNSTTVNTFSANASRDKTVNITVPVRIDDLDDVVIDDVSGGDIIVYRAGKVGSFVNVPLMDVALSAETKYAASLSLSIDSSTYVVTAQLKDQDGNNIGSAQTIDLPLESVVVSGSYNSQTKKVVLTLQNGSTIEFSVADLVAGLQSEITAQNPLSADLVTDGTTNKVLTAAEKTKLAGIEAGAEVNVQSDWNQSDDTSDDYIKNKPAIPSAPGTLDTTNEDSLSTSESEALSGNVKLHKVSKTGDYNDLSHKLEAGDNILIRNTHLPLGYEELEYISNGSNTRVNTGITPNVDNIKVELVVKPTSGVWRIFQSAASSSNVCGITGGQSNYSIELIYRGNNVAVSTIKRDAEHYFLIRATMVDGSGDLYVKDLSTGEEATNTGTYTYGNVGYPTQFSLFGNAAGLYASNENMVASLKFWVNGVLQLDYVPCKRMQNDVVGFYNKVSDNLITGFTGNLNAGTLAKNNVINVTGLAEVATSGDYNDLTNKPKIPDLTSDLTNDSGFITLNDIPSQEQSDWNEADTADPAYIKNKPTIPAAQVNSDWNASSGVSQILHKPNLATVATSGSYNDLTNKPTIPTVPTNVSSFTNDAGYLTQETDPIFSAWNKNYNDLTNTPVGGNGIELKSIVSDDYNVITWAGNESSTYINTEISMSKDDIEMELIVKPTIGSWYIWQTRPSGGLATGITGSATNDTILFVFCGTTLTSGIRRYANTSYKYLVRAKAKNGNMSLYVKRLDSGVSDIKTGTYTYTQQTLPLYMFGNQRGDRVTRGNYIYSAKMWLGGKLVLDYVPVMRKSDDAVMFFDTRTQSFITPNSGSLYKATADYLLPTPLAINAVAKGITIYSGSSAPASVTGNDGDIYIQEVV